MICVGAMDFVWAKLVGVELKPREREVEIEQFIFRYVQSYFTDISR